MDFVLFYFFKIFISLLTYRYTKCIHRNNAIIEKQLKAKPRLKTTKK